MAHSDASSATTTAWRLVAARVDEGSRGASSSLKQPSLKKLVMCPDGADHQNVRHVVDVCESLRERTVLSRILHIHRKV